MRKLIAVLLIFAHIALTAPIPEVYAMESANFRVSESAVSSGGGENTGIGALVPYSNVSDTAVGNAESATYKVAIGYINTIASNPPIFKSLIPDAAMRIVWNKGEPCPVSIPLDNFFSSPDNSPIT